MELEQSNGVDHSLQVAARGILQKYKRAYLIFCTLDQEINGLEGKYAALIRNMQPGTPETNVIATVAEMDKVNARLVEVRREWQQAHNRLQAIKKCVDKLLGTIRASLHILTETGTVH